MSKEVKAVENSVSENFHVGTNKETAQWLNEQQSRMEKGTRLLLDIALSIGEMLAGLQMSHSETFAEWVEKNLDFSRPTAYRYISLFNHKNQISEASNLNEAYKLIETLDAQKKQSETARAYQRVDEYRKTGVKPQDWRRGTDDKLVKEAVDRDARINAFKNTGEKKKEEQEKIEQERAEKEQEQQRQKAETDSLLHFLGQNINEQKKRSEYKEKIRLSADGSTDPFNDAIIEYIAGLENDNRRIEACYNIIKICKRIAVGLQGHK